MTKSDGIKYCKNLLKEKEVGYILNDEEFRTILKFLTGHVSVRQKIGIKKIFINSADFGSKCFYIERSDGTKTDFSYKSCFYYRTKESQFKEACRWAVWPQITEFMKSKEVSPGMFLSDESGLIIKKEDAHVHHNNKSFKEIVASFVKEFLIEIEKIKVTETADGKTRTEFVNKEFIKKFCDYHKDAADLKLITKEEHKKEHKTKNPK